MEQIHLHVTCNKMQIFYVYAQSAETTVEITNTTTGGGCYTDNLETIPGNGDVSAPHVERSRQSKQRKGQF